jgi:hypothetical protein
MNAAREAIDRASAIDIATNSRSRGDYHAFVMLAFVFAAKMNTITGRRISCYYNQLREGTRAFARRSIGIARRWNDDGSRVDVMLTKISVCD